MAIKVTKFGGSSMADAGQFRKVKAIIEADAEKEHDLQVTTQDL